MKTVKALSLFMALLMLLGAFAACASPDKGNPDKTDAPVSSGAAGETTVASTADVNGYIKDDLPEKLNFGGDEIWYLYDDKVQMKEFFVEEENGETVNDSIWKRNSSVEERLNVTLKFEGVNGNDGNQTVYCKAAQTDSDSGDNQFVIYGAYSRTIPLLSMQGFLQDLYDIDYINIDKPWWPSSLTSELTINNKLLMCTGDISPTVLWFMCGIFYNKDMWNENGFGYTLEDTVNSGEWTLDKFIEIIKDFYKDDGDGKINENDIFGYASYNACVDAFLNYAGVVAIVKDAEGNLVPNDDFAGERTDTIVTKLGQIATTATFHQSSTEKNERNLFYNSHALFLCDGTLAITNYKNAEGVSFTYGLIPGPKFDADQEKYVTNMRYPYQMYALNSRSKIVSEGAAVLEAQASAGYRSVTPIIFEVTMKSRYAHDSEVSKMYDILREGVCFDLGRIYNYSINNFYPTFRNKIFDGGTGWTQSAKTTAKTVKKQLDAVMEIYTAG
ncbi:MAG: hypothetical protein MJ137_04350 [Clostridia bacterium]|nr:hypothetical protein [Clostridia bacterium]